MTYTAPYPVYAALDTTSLEQALSWAAHLEGQVAGLKLGLEFYAAQGRSGIEAVARHSALPLFLDLKLYDIPNTVAKTVQALEGLPVEWLTVHASGGTAMLQAAQEKAHTIKLLGVTVLTSFSAGSLGETGISDAPQQLAARLAALAAAAGLGGLVASPHEAPSLKERFPGMTLFCPGVRARGAAADDQQRTMTPLQALDAGADYLVMGRSLLTADDPAVTLQQYFNP